MLFFPIFKISTPQLNSISKKIKHKNVKILKVLSNTSQPGSHLITELACNHEHILPALYMPGTY